MNKVFIGSKRPEALFITFNCLRNVESTNSMENIMILVFDKASRRGADNTEYAGLEISVYSRIASLFSRQIAIGNGGPMLALESMGAKRYFRCHSFNIALKYKQLASKSLV